MTHLFPSPAAPHFAGIGLAATLTRALAGQKSLYTQILALCRQQSRFVATGDTESLMSVLAARSRLLEQIAPLDKELQPYKGRWQQILDGLPARDRAVVGGLLKEVQGLLADILAADEQDKESLIRQKEQVGAEISRTVSGATLNRAYGIKPRS